MGGLHQHPARQLHRQVALGNRRTVHRALDELSLLTAGGAAVGFWLAFVRHAISPIWIAAFGVLFIALMVVHARVLQRLERARGAERWYMRGIDRLTGGPGSPAQGLGALDRLLPGLGGVVREGASAGLIETIKRMGEPTKLDGKPAVALPLRVTDGIVYVGIIPVAAVPALF